MNLVVVVIRFQVIDHMLPIGRQYIAGCSLEALIDLTCVNREAILPERIGDLHWPRFRCTAQQQVRSLARIATEDRSS